MTSFEYDGEGRVVRALTVREPEFSAWDRALFLDAWQQGNERRGEHGHKISDATDPENQFKFYVPPPTKDFAAEALQKEQEAYRKRYPNVDMGAILWRVEKRD